MGRIIHPVNHHGWPTRFNIWFNRMFGNFLDGYRTRARRSALRVPVLTVVVLLGPVA
jgi:hypothetical protein